MSSDAPIAVVLADDHLIVRHGLRMLLESRGGIEVVAEAGDARAAAAAVLESRPSVLVLDLNMPGDPPLDVLPEIVAAAPETSVVVLTMEDDPAFARVALDAGARGYLLKQAADDELIDAIHTVASGGTHVAPAIRRALDKQPADSEQDSPITPRETEVLRLIALGHTNTEIAERLGVSVRTIESHRIHIQQKLSTSTKPELVRYALQHGLI